MSFEHKHKRRYQAEDVEEEEDTSDFVVDDDEVAPSEFPVLEDLEHHNFLRKQIIEMVKTGALLAEDIEAVHELCQELALGHYRELKARVAAARQELENAEAEVAALPASVGRVNASSRLLRVARKHELRHQRREARRAQKD